MHQYLHDTEFAAKHLFLVVNDEEQQLASFVEMLRSKESELSVHRRDFETSDLNDDFSEAYMMAAFARQAEASEAVQRLKREISSLQDRVVTRKHSAQAIAGAILQVAKQGISHVHHGPSAAPTGRSIGSLSLRDVIWEARNQSMHYEEEKKYKNPLRRVFSTLEREQGPHFALSAHPKQSRAKQVLELIEWKDYASYLQDMKRLLP